MPRTRSNIRAVTSRKEGRSATHFGFSRDSGGFNDSQPPVITLVSSGTPGATTATITWTTDRVSDSQVFWGLTTAYTGATSPVMNFTMVTSHSVGLTGLVTATLYHYKVLSRTPDGGYAFSADGTFTTA
jgi:hypothetical protein